MGASGIIDVGLMPVDLEKRRGEELIDTVRGLTYQFRRSGICGLVLTRDAYRSLVNEFRFSGKFIRPLSEKEKDKLETTLWGIPIWLQDGDTVRRPTRDDE